jgi:hypothetical protein
LYESDELCAYFAVALREALCLDEETAMAVRRRARESVTTRFSTSAFNNKFGPWWAGLKAMV